MLRDAFVFPVSFAQERLWFLSQLQPDSSFYNMYRIIRLLGPLDVAILERGCAEVVRRHAALRTSFATRAGQPIQVIAPAISLPFRMLDLRDTPAPEREAEALRLATEAAFRPFDLVQGPLLRITILRLAEKDHILVLTMHHIISDGWSMEVFLSELSTLYAAFKAAESSPLPELPIQYPDYAAWQREWLRGDVLEGLLSYWNGQLANAPTPTELPSDSPRQPGMPQRGAMVSDVLPDALVSSLEALSRREGVTLFMTLLAAFQILVQRLTGSEDIVLGSPVASRNHVSLEPLIGSFLNTLVLRTDLSGNRTFLELLARVREVTLGAYAHQELPFELLVQELNPPRDLGRTPFFQVLFNAAEQGGRELDLDGIKAERLWLQEAPTRFDLTAYVRTQGRSTRLQLLYNSELYEHQRMRHMLDQYMCLLEQVAASPDKPIRSYTLVTDSVRPLLPDPSAIIEEPAQELVANMVASFAAQAPERTAVRQGGRDWSYRELVASATALAGELRARGLTKGNVIAVRGRPSFGMVAGMLGVFLSGGVLLTLDPELPTRRQQLLAQQAGAHAVLLVDRETRETGGWQEPMSIVSLLVDPTTGRPFSTIAGPEEVGASLPKVAPDDPAYIFFTSGSTGAPKGVLGCHKGLSHFLTWQRDTFAIGPKDRAAQLTTFTFDVVLRDVFTPLISGATLCLRDESYDPSPEATVRWLAQERVTMLHAVPALAKFWLSRVPEGASLRWLRWVFFAGEPLTDVLIRDWRAAFGTTASLVNLYGPTETTLAKCFYQVPADPLPGVQPIGCPLPQTQALVLSEENQLCGIGEVGQIVLRTPFRTLGYMGGSEAELRRFARNPYGNDPADLLYYTGDLGRYRPDGSLDILGRLDHQIKIRGVRVEPGEVTATLSRCPGVQDCIVIGRRNERDESYLAAYVVRSGEEDAQASHLRSCLSAQLPPALVPEVFVFVDHLPLTARGKVDLEALPQPKDSEQVPEQSNISPQTPVEEVVAGIFADVLGVEQIGVYESFFAHGGHSLLAMQIIFRIRDSLQTDLPLASIFLAPTVAELSQKILDREPQVESIARTLLRIRRMSAEERQRLLDQRRNDGNPVGQGAVGAQGAGIIPPGVTGSTPLVDHGLSALSGIKQRLLERRLRSALERQAYSLTIPRRAASEAAPLSFSQERLWFLSHMQPDEAGYSRPVALRISGHLQTSTLERSLTEIVHRHEVLRATFSLVDGLPAQTITPTSPLKLEVVDLTSLPQSQCEPEAQRLIAEIARRPIDLEQGPLLRATLLRLGDRDHVLIAVVHHIAFDAWSAAIFQRELVAIYDAFYAGQPSPLPDLPIQYADFAAWQKERLHQGALEEDLNYWMKQLAGAPPVTELPADRPRPPVRTHHGASVAFVLPEGTTEKLTELGQGQDATLFMVLLAAFKVLLHRLTGQDDLVVGTPIAGRNWPETEGLIGVFLNNLVLRTDVSGSPTFLELLVRVRDTVLGAYDHQELPFEKVLEETQPERDPSRTPLFQVYFNMILLDNTDPDLPDLRIEAFDLHRSQANFDLTIYVRKVDEGIHIQFTHNTDLFSQARMGEMLAQYQLLLEQIVSAPEKPVRSYSLLTPSAHAVLPDPCAALAEPTQELVTSMIVSWADRTPEQPAIRQGALSWTYAELASRADTLAQELQKRGLVQGDVVAVLGRPSFGLVSSMVGILRSGGVLLPIDHNLPRKRQQLMLQQAGARAILWVEDESPEDGKWRGNPSLDSMVVDPITGYPRQPRAGSETAAHLPAVSSDDPAYIFFTSGTTGVPKGVLGSHKGLGHFLTWQRDTFDIRPGDRAAQLTSLSFDVVLRDIFVPLVSGATLCLPDDAKVLGPEDLLYWLEEERITIVHTVPSLAQFWLAHVPPDLSLRAMRCIFLAGEPLTDTLIHQWRDAFSSRAEIVNLYGPTETTLAKCFYRIPANPPHGIQPVGESMPHAQALVLTEQNQICGIGEPGEIVLRTPFRTLGFVNPSREDPKRFVPNPFRDDEDDLVYYSGDRGRYRPDGLLEILGRIDDQVKIRGIRVEPGEITAALARHPAVEACVVVPRRDQQKETYLAAYVVASEDNGPGVGQLRAYLSQQLPAALIPTAFVFLEQLPLTPNGKVDRRALPEPGRKRSMSDVAFVAPRTPTEEVLAGIWAQVLGVDKVGVQHSFFELGGHSLLGTQVLARMRDAFQVELPLLAIFERPTVEGLADAVEQAVTGSAGPRAPKIQPVARVSRGVSVSSSGALEAIEDTDDVV